MFKLYLLFTITLASVSSCLGQGRRPMRDCELQCVYGVCRGPFFKELCICDRGFYGRYCDRLHLYCPDDIMSPTDQGVNYTFEAFEASFTDGMPKPSNVLVTSTPESGSRFYCGYNLVTMVAYDGPNDIGMCEFTITVTDKEAPAIVCPMDQIYTIEDQETYKIVEFNPTSVTDNVDDDITVTSDPRSGSEFTLGVHEVQMTARDDAGNSGSCTFMVVIQGNPFECNNGEIVRSSDVCNNVVDCGDGADELDCAPQFIDGTPVDINLRYNTIWRFQGQEGFGVLVSVTTNVSYGVHVTIGEGTSPGKNILTELGYFDDEFYIYLPSHLIWINVTNYYDVEGTAVLLVESSNVTSPIYIEEGSVLINGSQARNEHYIWKVSVPEDKWIAGTYLETPYSVAIKVRTGDDGLLVPLTLSYRSPSEFLYPVNEIWIFQGYDPFLLNASAAEPRIFTVGEDDDATELNIQSTSVTCYEEAWIIQIPESSHYAMKVSQNAESSYVNILFFEGIYPSAFPLGAIIANSYGPYIQSFVTHVTNTTISVVTFNDECYRSDRSDAVNIHVELKEENLNVTLGEGDVFSFSSAQDFYTDTLLLNRRIFFSDNNIFLESTLFRPQECSVLYLGQTDAISDISFLHSSQLDSRLLQTQTRNVGVLNGIFPNEDECPYSLKVHPELPAGYMVCTGYTTVVTLSEVCDTEWQCPDGEDEFECDPQIVSGPVDISVSRPTGYYPYASQLKQVRVFTFTKENSDSFFFLNLTTDVSRYYSINLRIGAGSYQGETTEAIKSLNNSQLSETGNLLFFREDTIWIEIYAEEDFEATLFVGNRSDVLFCSDSLVVAKTAACDGLFDCRSGEDESECPPLNLSEISPLRLPDQIHVDTITWRFTAVEEAGFKVSFDYSVRYDIDYLAIGRGGDPSDVSSILLQWSEDDRDDFELIHIFNSADIWILMRPSYRVPYRSPGSVQVLSVIDVDIMDGESTTISSSDVSANSAIWIFRFPAEIGGRMECDILPLQSSSIRFGVGEDFQNVIGEIKPYSHSAHVQVPFNTIWVVLVNEESYYDYNYYGYYSYNGESFTCRVIGFNTTVSLRQDVETIITSDLNGYGTFSWIGWTLVPTDSLGTFFNFTEASFSDGVIGGGSDISVNATPGFLYSRYDVVSNIFIRGSTWVFFSSSSCDYECLSSVAVSGVDPANIVTCDASYHVLDETVICDGEPLCYSSSDEIACEIRGSLASIQSTNYPEYIRSREIQRWEYFTSEANASVVIQFRELTLDYGVVFYAGIGSIAPENSSVDYRPAADCVLTQYDPIQDLYLESNTVWIVMINEYGNGLERTRMLAEIRLLEGELLRCEDGRNIAFSDQICDALWHCDNGEDEIGCNPIVVEGGDIHELVSAPEKSSWVFRLSSPDDQRFIVDVGHIIHSTIEIGSGSNFNDSNSTLYVLEPYRYYSDIYINSETDIWITIDEPSYGNEETSLTLRVISQMESLDLHETASLQLVFEIRPGIFTWVFTTLEGDAFFVDFSYSVRYDYEYIAIGKGLDPDNNSSILLQWSRDSEDQLELTNFLASHEIWIKMQTRRYYGTSRSPGTVQAIPLNNVDVGEGNSENFPSMGPMSAAIWIFRFPDNLGGRIECDNLRSHTLTFGVGEDLRPQYSIVELDSFYGSVEIQIPFDTAWVILSDWPRYTDDSFSCRVMASDNKVNLMENVETNVAFAKDENYTFQWIGWNLVPPGELGSLIHFETANVSGGMLGAGSSLEETAVPFYEVNGYTNQHMNIFIHGSAWIYFSSERCYDACEQSIAVSAVAPNGINTCADSYVILSQEDVCDGEPFCPRSDDEIGCEIKERNATIQSTNYPHYILSREMQVWEYYTTEENASVVVQFTELTLDYGSIFYAGTGYVSPENSSVDYRPAADCVLTRYDPIQDLYLDSNRVWIVLSHEYGGDLEYTRMLANLRVVDSEDDIMRCRDGSHIVFSENICDNIWTCDDGEDESGCDATVLGFGDVYQLASGLKSSWIFRLSSPNEDAFALILGGYISTSIKIGRGSNVFDISSITHSISRYGDNEDILYFGGMGDSWIMLDESSYFEATVNLTVVSQSELFNCGDSYNFINNSKVCDTFWDCQGGLDETDCQPTNISEYSSIEISYRGHSSERVTRTWVFEVPNGLEAVLTLHDVDLGYTGILFGLGTDPTDTSTRPYSVNGFDFVELVVPGNTFWIKLFPLRSYGYDTGDIEITARPLQEETCEDDEFLCTLTRECVPSSGVCDGIEDCLDRTDELSCPCLSYSEHRCGNARCVERESVCSSSGYYSFGRSCLADRETCDFECTTWDGKNVVSNMFVCDGFRDCIDGSDEEVENCECKTPAYSCGDKCISPNQVCDGFADCNDERDESDCECSSFEITCGEDECVPYWDGCLRESCMDVDECQACPETYFQCSDFTCVPQSNVCNYYEDCPLGEDETGCGEVTTASSNSQGPCSSNPCGNRGTCWDIPPAEYICVCKEEYLRGKNCDQGLELTTSYPYNEDLTTAYFDICVINPCQNGGFCVSLSLPEYICLCDNGFYGQNCEEGIDFFTDTPNTNSYGLTTTAPEFYDIFLDVNETFTLSSENYLTGSYGVYDISWTITAPPGYGIQLEALDTRIGYDRSLTIGAGSSIGVYVISEIRGYYPASYLLRSSTIWIHFTGNKYGYSKAEFSLRLLAISDIGISAVWYLNPGQQVIVESPGYPENYPVKVDKAWSFETLAGHGFVVNFTSFSLENNWDYVSVGSGVEPRRSSTFATFTGNDVTRNYSLPFDAMWMRFTSDLSKTSQGFRAVITSVIAPDVSGTIRLVGGDNPREGRVEVLYNGVWGTVCDDSWDDLDASVVCRQLGFGEYGEAFGYARFGQGSGRIWLDNVQCYGFERRLEDCGNILWGVHDCSHSEDAGVRCEDESFLSTDAPTTTLDESFLGTDESITLQDDPSLTTDPSLILDDVYELLPNTPVTINYTSSYRYGYYIMETWELIAPVNHSILLSFVDIRLAGYYSSSELTVQVVLAHSMTNIQIARYTGYEEPDDLFIRSNEIILEYSSPDRYYSDSFSVIVTAIPDEVIPCDVDSIPPDVRCDGRIDCLQGEDEDNCGLCDEETADEEISGHEYLVQIIRGYGRRCGGTLINSRWVLTSTTCILHSSASELEIQLSSSESSSYSAVAVVHIPTDSGENSGLTLLKLNETVDGFGSDVFAPCLPSSDSYVQPGTYVNIFGWSPAGFYSDEGNPQLVISREPVVSMNFCNLLTSTSQEDYFCTGYIQSYGADCYQVYGGPVMTEDEISGCQKIIGVVVNQYSSCGKPFAPKTFPLVSSQVELMKEIILHV